MNKRHKSILRMVWDMKECDLLFKLKFSLIIILRSIFGE